jgi:hypothetical protein
LNLSNALSLSHQKAQQKKFFVKISKEKRKENTEWPLTKKEKNSLIGLNCKGLNGKLIHRNRKIFTRWVAQKVSKIQIQVKDVVDDMNDVIPESPEMTLTGYPPR